MIETGNSSLSDSKEEIGYLNLCRTAVTDEESFSKFRSNREYQRVLEHVGYSLAKKYIVEIEKRRRLDRNAIKELRKLSEVGNPATFKFKKYGHTSPTVLRYVKVQSDLEMLFGKLSNFTVTEIGVGFGGQASVLGILSGVKNMNLYDLPEVLKLAGKFIKSQKIKFDINFCDGRNPKSVKSDLLISNYAFSELNSEVQAAYMKNVILHAERGYITWNALSFAKLGGYSLGEILRMIPNSNSISEIPSTSPSNSIIVWGAPDEEIAKLLIS